MNSYKNAVFSVLLFVLSVGYVFLQLYPQEVELSVQDETLFSVDRAKSHVHQLSQKPHFTGSDNHSSVRNYLINELEKLGLEVHTQKDFSLNSTGQISIPENIIASLPANKLDPVDEAETKSLLLLSHYDSAPHASFGAADAASGVATILEATRAFLASKEEHTNNIIICFTDAEEIGLLGANLFAKQHPLANDVGLVLNFEARGTAGPSNMIVETNDGNSALIDSFKAANVNYPLANSLMYNVYKILPNDTDSTVFREELDVQSLFFAFIDNHFNYHTANDRLDKLDLRSLAHQGDYLLPLLKTYANTDLAKLQSSKDYVYFDFPVLGVVSYPSSWSIYLVVFTFVLFIGLVVFGLKKNLLSYREIILGLIIFWALLLINALIAFLGWKLLLQLYPSYHDILQGFPYNGHNYIIAFVAFSLAVCLIFHHIFRFKIRVKNAYVGPLFTWLLINLILLIYLPGATYLIIPTIFSLLIFILLLVFRLPNSTIMWVLSLPLLFLVLPLVQFFPVGLGLNFVFISTIFITLSYGLLMPIINHYPFNKGLSYISFCVAIGFFIVAHIKSPFSADQPQPTSLVYVHDEDKNQTYWASYDQVLTKWNKTYFSQNEQNTSLSKSLLSKYHTKFTQTSTAPKIKLLKAQIDIDVVGENNTSQTTQLQISPRRKLHRIDIYVDKEINFEDLHINQKTITQTDNTAAFNHFSNRYTDHLLTYYVVDQENLILEFTHPANAADLKFDIIETSYDLLLNDQFKVSERPRNEMPKPFVINDAIMHKHSIILP